jgi:alpha-beta hydrolase superfamily lysophospholipase
VFLLGHSLGSLIAADYVLRDPDGLKGVILSGLATEPAGVAKPHLVAIARLLSRVWPTFSIASELGVTAISRDPAVVKAYQEDPLVHGVASVRWGAEALNTVAWVRAHASELKIPVLLIHGGADRLNLPSGSQDFYSAVPHADKELRLYPGSYHECHNDLDHAQVAADLENWLSQHL